MRWLATGWLMGLLGVLGVLCVHPARADRLELIHARGTLVVGVKSDYPPFGMLDGAGNLVGLEPDLARDLARRLNVGLRLVGVNTANRLEKLADGTVDVLIATLGDTAKRREIATLIEPDYYASGVSIMLPSKRKVSDWADLRGQTVCTTQGAYFNRPMAERYLLDLQIYGGARDAKLALRDGRCAGWLSDDTAIAGDLRSPEWQGFAMPLPALMLSPWAIAIPHGEEGGKLDGLIGDAVADWLRSGFLAGLEHKWQLPPSSFVTHAHENWSRRGPDGALVCVRAADGSWPASCRDAARAAAEQAGGLEKLGARVKELTGLDLTIIYDRYDRGQFLHGLLLTLALVASCLVGSVITASLGAIVIDARLRLVSAIVSGIGTFARMTPPLLQIYVVVFGLGSMTARWGFTLNSFLATTFCLSLYAGSAGSFALIEAAELVRHQDREFRIRAGSLPIVFRLAYQPLVAALINIAKATGMASAVAVPELISSSTAIIAERGNAAVMMNVLMVVYFVIVLVVVRLFRRLHGWVLAHVAA